MNIEVEWLSGVIRVGDESFKGPNPGTTYDFVCSIVRQGDHAFLLAAHGSFSRETYRLIRDELQRLGIKSVTFEKLNTDVKRKFVVGLD